MDAIGILNASVKERRTLLCIGLDTDMSKFPEDVRSRKGSQFEVNRSVVDGTREFAAAFKLNMAFYEVEGEEGARSMSRTISYIREVAPYCLVILDGKKGDIGNTSEAYARAAFERLGAHSVTLNGYMGSDAISPFTAYKDRLSFVLCRTSNRSAPQLQDLGSSGERLYMSMARLVSSWNTNRNLGLVVGATFPDEIRAVRGIVGQAMPFLVPGIGAQGGDLSKVLEMGTDEAGSGVLINVSRDIMFAFQRSSDGLRDIGGCAKGAASEYNERIRAELERLGKW